MGGRPSEWDRALTAKTDVHEGAACAILFDKDEGAVTERDRARLRSMRKRKHPAITQVRKDANGNWLYARAELESLRDKRRGPIKPIARAAAPPPTSPASSSSMMAAAPWQDAAGELDRQRAEQRAQLEKRGRKSG